MDDNEQNSKKEIPFNVKRELQHAIRRDWGLFYKKCHLYDKALENFDESLTINENAFKPMIEKSRCLLEECAPDQALSMAKQCETKYPQIVRVKYHRNNCLYEQNHFEDSLKMAWQTLHQHPTARHAKSNIQLINSTIEQSIELPKNCLYNMRRDIDRLQRHKLKAADSRPIWKILRESKQCDVISTRSASHTDIAPIKEKQREQNANRMHSMYLDSSSAKDIIFLNSLITSDRLMLPQTPKSNAILADNINKHLRCIDACEQMLWTREPCYAKTYTEDGARTIRTKVEVLHRSQHHTRIGAFLHLAEIKRLQKTNFVAMLKWVDKIMSTVYATKTERVFPRKFEFVNEVYNIVGLAYLNRLRVPNNIMAVPQQQRMHLLLDEHFERKPKDDVVAVTAAKVFSDRKAFIDPEAPDESYLAYKREVDHYERLLLHSVYPIEKCYLYHEIGKLHLAHRKLDETKQLALRMVECATVCGNYVWIVHGYLSMIRVDLAQSNPTKMAKKLGKLLTIRHLLNEDARHFLKTAYLINRVDEEQKFAKSNKNDS